MFHRVCLAPLRDSGCGGRMTERKAKPGGTSMAVVFPAQIMSRADHELLKGKLDAIRQACATFATASNLQALGSLAASTLAQLFPGYGSILLARVSGNYSTVASAGIDLDPGILNASAFNSIVRVAGESEPISRRAIYIPEIGKQDIWLASKFDRVGAHGEFDEGAHEFELGTIIESGLKFDQISLANTGTTSVAVCPVMRYKHTDPVGSVVLIGEGFSNPPVDLIALIEFADALAVPLESKK